MTARERNVSSHRTFLLVAMWAAAFLAVAAIQWARRPGAEDAPEPRIAPRAAPVHEAAEAPRTATGASRVNLPVEAASEAPPRFYRGDRRHSGRSAAIGPAQAPSLRYRFETGGRVIAQPVLHYRRVYVGSFSGTLYALDGRGAELWKRDLGGPIYSTPYVARDGTVFVGSDAGYLYAIDTNGQIRFRLATEAEADTGVVPAPGNDGLLYFAAGRDLWSITKEGRVQWRFRARSKIFTTPAIDNDGTIYVGSQDDNLYAIAPDGKVRWSYEASADIDSSPVIGDDGTIYFGCDDRRLYAVDRDGRLKFRVLLGGMIRGPVALGPEGTVLVGVYGPHPRLVAVAAADGAERWSFPVTDTESDEIGVASGPLVDRDGRIYFGAHDDYLYALTPDGKLLWTFGAEGDIDTPPVLGADGTLYFGSDDGRLYAIGAPAAAATPAR